MNWRKRNAPGLGVVVGVVTLVAAGIWYAISNPGIMVEHVNPALWVVSNLMIVYAGVALIVWVILYGLLFKWNSTPAGADVFWFTLSLAGLVLLVFVGVFLNPQQPWYSPPTELLVWRPFLRYLVYLGIAITVTRLDWSLVQRLRGRQALLFKVTPRQPRA